MAVSKRVRRTNIAKINDDLTVTFRCRNFNEMKETDKIMGEIQKVGKNEEDGEHAVNVMRESIRIVAQFTIRIEEKLEDGTIDTIECDQNGYIEYYNDIDFSGEFGEILKAFNTQGEDIKKN